MSSSTSAGLQNSESQNISSPASVIEKFENSFRDILNTFVSENSASVLVHQNDQRPSVEHSVLKFLELANETESFFLKQKATIALTQPELILQEEIQEMTEDLKRKDEVIESHRNKLIEWRKLLVSMQQKSITTNHK